MALQREAIENRLEGLKQDDRRMMFDSKLRAFRLDSKSAVLNGDRPSKLLRKTEPESSIEHMVALLEELSRRIDRLERKDRAITEKLRQRSHRDHIRRTVVGVVGLGLATALVILLAIR